MKYRWISWYAVPGTITEIGKFELHYPWWISGDRRAVTVAAVIGFEAGLVSAQEKKP